MKKFVFSFIVCLLIFSCNVTDLNRTKVLDSMILIPSSESIYEVEDLIFFSLDQWDNEIEWYSNIDGKLGEGDTLYSRLSKGTHQITAQKRDKILDTISIDIISKILSEGDIITRSIYQEVNHYILPLGIYSPVIYSFGSSNMNINIPARNMISSGASQTLEGNHFLNLKSSNIRPQRQYGNLLYNSMGKRTLDETVKEFILPNTANPGNDPHIVRASLEFTSDEVNFWLDENSNKNEELLEELWLNISKIGILRVKAIWGYWADINKNSKVDVLISPKINEEEVAIGFFNTADFYEYNDNIDSDEYNIFSNQIDIIYLGDPSASPDDFAYSVNSLTATFCHEMTHMINYSNKVYLPGQAGIVNTKPEELFLDEGLAHLTESLCGFGESGGNLAFLSKFLENTGHFSFNGPDLDGSLDSVGKRGGVAAFLSYLVWKHGGIRWNSQKPGVLDNSSGLIFLKKLLISDKTGWENLSFALSSRSEDFLLEWIQLLNEDGADSFPSVVDDYTGEELVLNPYWGNLQINSNSYPLQGVVRASLEESFIIIPYSFRCFDQVTTTDETEIIIEGELDKGKVLIEFLIE
ncbi:hypothetical protein EW093_02070 [Thiospirochaeta perfilievii]|uniref:Peptidase M30 n=1 Tax=Thiospirochaeta perfilievii TaxID=252967 RepID=A0A5C1QA55_9SPIO|nr:hypothetical protein [Thiospirochaeta perfilievii]QEN03534.1 hypothetical protein EW093_02070 [Thiospirochaeta perfilievii]